jgi:hypothetical protein
MLVDQIPTRLVTILPLGQGRRKNRPSFSLNPQAKTMNGAGTSRWEQAGTAWPNLKERCPALSLGQLALIWPSEFHGAHHLLKNEIPVSSGLHADRRTQLKGSPPRPGDSLPPWPVPQPREPEKA